MTSTVPGVAVAVAAALTVALCAAALVATVVVRILRDRRLARDAELTDAWIPALLGGDPPAPVASLSPDDARALLALWNRMRAAVRGRAADRLESVGRRLGLDAVARRLLDERGRLDDLISAVVAAGAMRDETAVGEIERHLRASSITLRAEAARALVRLRGVAAVPVLAEVLDAQPDWHPALIASVVEELPVDVAAGALAATAAAAAADRPSLTVRLLHALVAVPSTAARNVALELLAGPQHPDVVSSCLRLLARAGNRADAPVVRLHLAHPTWHVRVEAAFALGAVGGPDDEDALAAMLDDDEWWVRQRAAEALARIASSPAETLNLRFGTHPEAARFAGDAYSPHADLV